MKRLIFLFVYFNFSSGLLFSQCPQPGLKFKTASCNSANDLKFDAITCSTLKVKWQGDYNQRYIVNATGIYSYSNNSYDATPSNYSCDYDGNCEASISVKPGTDVNWSVEGQCMQNNNVVTSYTITGPRAYIPVCNSTAVSNTLKAYPNPTTGDLMVIFNADIGPNTQIMISDVSGKNALNVPTNSVTRINNGFKLNLHNLPNGTYFLKVISGPETSQAKFVLIKN